MEKKWLQNQYDHAETFKAHSANGGALSAPVWLVAGTESS